VSDERITADLGPDSSSQIVVGITQHPVMEPDALRSIIRPPAYRWFLLRLLGAVWAATVFVRLCWWMGHIDAYATRILAGPMLLCQRPPLEENLLGLKAACVLLPIMFMVGVWRNTATFAFSFFAWLGWIGFGIMLEEATCRLRFFF
jgi:hypothetical protein